MSSNETCCVSLIGQRTANLGKPAQRTSASRLGEPGYSVESEVAAQLRDVAGGLHVVERVFQLALRADDES